MLVIVDANQNDTTLGSDAVLLEFRMRTNKSLHIKYCYTAVLKILHAIWNL